MAFVSTPQGVEVVLKATQSGVPVVNVFHVDAGAPVDSTTLEDIVDVFATWYSDTWRGVLHESYILQEIVATDISVEDGEQATQSFVSGGEGLITGDPTPANAAVVISQRSGRTGRSYRGRTYSPAIPVAGVEDEHNITTSYAGSLTSGFADLMDALETAGYALKILSKVLNGVARVAGVLTSIVEIVVNTKIDSQRRRTAN